MNNQRMTGEAIKDLGKCYGKQESFRVYKEGYWFALYIVEKVGTRLEAFNVGYFQDLENMDMAIHAVEQELACLMVEATL